MISNKTAILRILNRRPTQVVTLVLLGGTVFQILHAGFEPFNLDSILFLAVTVSSFGVLFKWHHFYWLLVGVLSAFIVRGGYWSYSLWGLHFTQEPPGLAEKVFSILPVFVPGVIVPLLFLGYYVFAYLFGHSGDRH